MRTFTRRSILKGALAGPLVGFYIGCSPIRAKQISTEATKIAFVTDFHFSGGELQEKMWRRLVASLAKEKVDLVIGGGDWITEGPKLSRSDARKRLEKFAALWGELHQPKELIPGNHDLVREEGTGIGSFDLFREVFPDWIKNKRIDFLDYTLLTVQSIEVQGGSYRGYISSDQIQWVKNHLAHIPKDKGVIVLTHVPLLTNLFQRTKGPTFVPPADQYVNNSIEFLDLFKEHLHLLVLQGHLHVHETITWNHTTFLTGGALCGKWWDGAHYGTPPGFRLIELHEGQVSGRYVSL